MSETVARTGWPCSPNTSQSTTGHAANVGASAPIAFRRAVSLSERHAGLAHAGQVALDIGHEHRDADARKALGHHLQRDGLAGARRAGDEPVAIGEGRAAATARRRRSGQSAGDRAWRVFRRGENGPNLTLCRPAPAPGGRTRRRVGRGRFAPLQICRRFLLYLRVVRRRNGLAQPIFFWRDDFWT